MRGGRIGIRRNLLLKPGDHNGGIASRVLNNATRNSLNIWEYLGISCINESQSLHRFWRTEKVQTGSSSPDPQDGTVMTVLNRILEYDKETGVCSATGENKCHLKYDLLFGTCIIVSYYIALYRIKFNYNMVN